MDDSSIEPVQVFVRIRPEIPEDTVVSELSGSHSRHKCVAGLDGKTLRVDPPDAVVGRKNVSAIDSKLYAYDRVFGEESDQEDIYASVSHHVRATIRGYNTTIFALGCTGSGKTFTMSGNSTNPGIVPRAISEIFSMIEATAAEEKDVYFYVRLSLVELYNNNFRNLLDFASKELSDRAFLDTTMSHMSTRGSSPSSLHPSIAGRSDKIEVRESQTAGVFLAGHNLRIPVTTAQEAFLLIARGNKNRATGATNCNDVSSRSHCILTIHVESRLESTDGAGKSELRLGKMHLVDLAGSERLKLSGAEGDTLTETQNINLSLTALGDVLAALSHNAKDHSRAANKPRSPGRAPFAMMPVPYRNSKLTHLLKDSLGGNSKTTMITTICTLSEYYQQTLISLNYASRAKRVKNRSLVNRDVIGDSGIHAVTSEIERLRARLDERTSEFDRLRMDQQRDASENLSLKSRLQELNKVNENEKRQLEAQMSNVIHNQAGQLAAQRERISTLQTALQDELALSQNRIAEQEREIKWLKKALDDSTQAVQYPTEQIERMQKVIDAWQEQARSTQDELSQANASVDESRNRMLVMRSEFNAMQSERDSLREKVEVWSQREAELRQSLAKEKKATESAITKSDALSKESVNLKISVTTMVEESKRRESYFEESVLRSSQLEAELRAQLEKAEKRIIELTLKNEEVEEQNDELRTRLSSTMTALEKQLLMVVDDSKMSVKQNEFRAEVAEKRAKSIEAELDMFKRKITIMQSDTQEIITQRDAKISALWVELQETKTAMDKQISDYQRRLAENNTCVSDLQNRLAVSEKTVEDITSTTTRKAAEFAASLEARAIEVRELKRQYTELTESVYAEYDTKVVEIKSSTDLKIASIMESKEEDVRVFKANLEAKYRKEVDDLTTEISQLKEAASRSLEELRQKHRTELDAVLAVQMSTSEKTATDARVQFDSERAQLVAQHTAETNNLIRQHEVDMDNLRDKSREALEASEGKLYALFDARIAALETDSHNQIKSLEKKHDELMANEIDKKIERLRKEHRAELQLLRSQHLQLIQDMEGKYNQSLSDARADIEHAYAEKERALQAELAQRVAATDSRAADTVREAEERYKSKMQAATVTLQAQIDEISKQKQFIEEEVQMRLTTERNSLTSIVQSQADSKHQERLEVELRALRLEMTEASEVQLHVAIDQCRLEAEADFKAASQSALSQLKHELDSQHDVHCQEILHQHALVLASVREEYDQKIQRLTMELQQELSITKSETQLRFSEQLEKSLLSQKQHLQADFRVQMDVAISNITREHAETLKQKENKIVEEADLLARRHSDDLQVMQLSHDSASKEWEQKLSIELNRSSALVEQVEQLKIELKSLSDQFNFERNELKQAYELQNRSTLDLKMLEMDSQSKDAMKRQADHFQTELQEALATQAVSMQDAHYQEIQSLQRQLDISKETLAAELERTTAAFRQQQAAELQNREAQSALHTAELEKIKFEQIETLRERTLALQADCKKIVEETESKFKTQLKGALEAQCNEFKSRETERAAEAEASALARVAEAQEKARALAAAEIANLTAAKEAMMTSLQERASADVSSALSSQLNVLLSNHSAEVNALNQRYEGMRSQMEQRLRDFEQDRREEVGTLTNMIRAMEQSERELSEILSKERSNHADESERLRKLHLVELATTNAAFEARLVQEKGELASYHEKIVRDMSDKYATESSSARIALAEEFLRKEDDLKVLLLEERQKYEANLAAEKLVISEAEQGIMRTLLEKNELSLQEQAGQYEKDLMEIDRLHSSKVCTLERNVEELREQLLESHARDAELSSTNKSLLAELNRSNHLHEERLIEIKTAYEAKMSDAIKLREQHLQENLDTQMQLVVSQLDIKVVELQAAHVQECAQLKSVIRKLEDRADSLAAQTDALHTMNAEFSAERNETAELRKREIDEVRLRMEHRAKEELERLTALQEIQLDDLKSEASKELSAAQTQLEAEKERFAEVSARELDRELSLLRSELSRQHHAALVNAEADYAERVAAMAFELSAAQTQLEAEKERFAEVSARELDRELSLLRSELSRQHHAALVRAEADYAERVAAMVLENEQVEKELRRELAREKNESEADFQGKYEILKGKHEDEVSKLQQALISARENETRYVTSIERLEANHADAIHRLQVEHTAALDQCRQAEHTAAESKYMYDLQTQIEELKMLMKSVYDESSMSGPKLDELHRRYLDVFKSTSGATSALNSEHVRDPADRSMVDDDSGYRQRHQVDSSRGALGHDSTNYFDSDRDRLEYTHRGGSLHGTNWGRNSEVGVEYADDIMLRSVDSQRSAATSVTWGTKATSDRPSPTEQLVAAILDGDVQGIRSIVHSKGDTLHSPYWLEVMKSILPLHRAISGLHFHGSDTRLISTLETLIQLGCNVKAVDHVGQTAVHKALQVCTSTSVKLVLDCLLSKGASASMRTSTGDAPIHTECRRLRIASPEAISCLLSHAADPNALCAESKEGMNASTERLGSPSTPVFNVPTSTPLSLILATAASFNESCSAYTHSRVDRLEHPEKISARRGACRAWVLVAGILLRAGAKWDKLWRQSSTGYSQLHLLMQAFPPPREQSVAYRALLSSAVKAGLSPLSRDNKPALSALHVLCIKLGTVTVDTYPDAGNVLHALLHACFDESATSGLGQLGLRADPDGRTLLQIKEEIPGSWLSASQKLLREAVSRMTGGSNRRGVLLELNEQVVGSSSNSHRAKSSYTHLAAGSSRLAPSVKVMDHAFVAENSVNRPVPDLKNARTGADQLIGPSNWRIAVADHTGLGLSNHRRAEGPINSILLPPR